MLCRLTQNQTIRAARLCRLDTSRAGQAQLLKLAPGLVIAMAASALLASASCLGANLTPQDDAPPATAPATCIPNRDGVITADEMPIAMTATPYTEAPPGVMRTVALSGVGAAASLRWDFTSEYHDDVAVELAAVPLARQWFAAKFPHGQFISPAGAGLWAIYEKNAQGLWLWGTASTNEAPAEQKTLVIYPVPVPALRFPVQVSAPELIEVPLTDAVINGLPFVGTDRFEIAVVAAGRADLPYVRFSPVLYVASTLTRTASPGGARAVKQTASYLYECFGEVVRAESALNDPARAFTQAALLRRLTFRSRHAPAPAAGVAVGDATQSLPPDTVAADQPGRGAQ